MTISLDHATPEPPIEYIRRSQIIEAAIVTISELGYVNTTLLQIARRGNVSAALISHYFQDKNGLMQEVFRRLVWRVQRSTRQRLAQAKTPRERVEAVIDANLTPEEFDHHSSVAWLAFWGQVVHVPAFRRIQSIYQARMLSTLSHALRKIVPLAEVRKTATAIAALIDGIWLRSTLSDGNENDSLSARIMVRDMADVILAARVKQVPASMPLFPTILHNFIKGVAYQSSNPRTVTLYNPATGAPLAQLERAGESEVDQAILAAQSGFNAWAHLSGAVRGRVLARIAVLVKDNAVTLARLHALETGQAIRVTKDSDILPGAAWLEYLSAIAVVNAGAPDIPPIGFLEQSGRQPLGIVLEDSDDFYPFQNACRKITAALACGNAIIFNTAGRSVCLVLELAKLCKEAGVPDGLLNILHGQKTLTLAPHQQNALKIPPSTQALEPCGLGGLVSFLVLEDADPVSAARVILEAVLRPEGQRGLLVFAAPAIQTRLLLELKESLKRIVIGDPMDDKTELGCLMSKTHRQAFQAHLKAATMAGATLLAGGVFELDGCDQFIAPALLFVGCASHLIPSTQPQGPVVYLLSFTAEHETCPPLTITGAKGAICIFDADIKRAHDLAVRLSVETCLINPSSLPPGLVASRLSHGLEPDGCLAAISRYSRAKTIYTSMAVLP